MPEMSTLLGYEIVDKKARELIANLGGGDTNGLFRTVQKDYRYAMENGQIAGEDFEGCIHGSPVIGLKQYGYTEVADFESEETLYNPRAIPNSSLTYLRYYFGSGDHANGYLKLPFDSPTFFGGFPITNESNIKNYLRTSDSKCACNKVIKDYRDKYWVSDEVDFESGKYYKRTHSVTYDGSSDEAWTKVYPDNGDNWIYSINLGGYSATDYVRGVCDRLPSNAKFIDSLTPTGTTPKNLEYVGFCTTWSGTTLYICIGYYMNENTVDELRNILSQYPITIYYPLYQAKEIDITDDQTIESYKRFRLVDRLSSYSVSIGQGLITEYAYPITEAGAALALGARETSVAKYETQLDRLYRHFKRDRYVFPYCTIVFPNNPVAGSSNLSSFNLFFTKKKMNERTSAGSMYISDRNGGYCITDTLASLPENFDHTVVSEVIDFIISNYTASNIKTTSSYNEYRIEHNYYTYYTNSKYVSFPSIELDIPFDGNIKFPKISDMEITHGSKGQLLTSEGDGTIGFTTLPPSTKYEDRLYTHFSVSKHEYPYIHMAIAFDKLDAFIFFAKNMEETSWGVYTMSGEYMSASIPRTGGLTSEVCLDIDRLLNYIVENVEWNSLSTPVKGTYSLSSLISLQSFSYHYINIDRSDKGYNVFDLRQMPVLTTERGVRFTSGVHGHTEKQYYYGEAGQYLISNGDGSVSFADGAGESGFNDVYAETSINMGRRVKTVIGEKSVAIGYQCEAIDIGSYAHGFDCRAIGSYAHAEGCENEAIGLGSHAEGSHTEAIGVGSHAEGHYSKAEGYGSHAEGWNTKTSSNVRFAHAEGSHTIASGEAQHVQGKYNIEDTENKYAHIVGGGLYEEERKNIHTLDWEGNAVFAGDVTDGNGDSIASVKALVQSGGATDVTVPTKVSELENDTGYITADDLTTLDGETIYSTERKTIEVTAYADTVIDSITLPAGTYYVQGMFQYSGTDLRYLQRLKVNNTSFANVSLYDNAGVVVGCISGVCELDSEATVEYQVYLNKRDESSNPATCELKFVSMTAARISSGVTIENSTDSHIVDYSPAIKSVNHRGYSAGAPENTLPAYILSKQKGFEYAECDVAFTSDGVAVLMHDDTIDRTSNGSGNVSSLTYEQLLTYDFGSWFSAEYTGTKIPTFEEFIKLCKQIGLHPYIELKSSGNYTQAQITSIVDMVKANGMRGKVTYISFNADFLGYVKSADPAARLGYLSSAANDSVITTVTNLRSGSNEVYAGVKYSVLTDSFITKCINANIPLEIWTVNDAEYIRNMNSYISGVTSDSLIAGDILRSEYIDSVGTIGFPTDENGTADHGVAGQFLVSNGDGTVSFVDGGASVDTVSGGELKPWLYDTSGEDVLVGIYNGKPLYRKSFNINVTVNSSTNYYAEYVLSEFVSNIDTLVDYDVYNHAGNKIPQLYLNSKDDIATWNLTAALTKSADAIRITGGTSINYTDAKFLFIVEYTKTTDAEGSGNGLNPYGIYNSKLDDIEARLSAFESIVIAEGGAY